MSGPIVSIIGSTGYVGKFLMPSLLNAVNEGRIKELRVLISEGKVGNPMIQTYGNTGAKIVPVNYSSVSSLSIGIKGSDVVLSALGINKNLQAEVIWKNLLDAMIVAGVKIYFPSEFGHDTKSPEFEEFKNNLHPVFKVKKDHVREAESKGLTPFRINCGPIMEYVFFPFVDFDSQTHKWTVVEGALDQPCALTSERDIGMFTVEAIIMAFKDPINCPKEFVIYSEIRTLREFATILDESTGHKTTFESVSYDLMKAKYSQSMNFGNLIMLLFAKGSYDYSNSPSNNLLNPEERRWKLRKFEDYVKDTGGVECLFCLVRF